jgi:hypothetical protein
MEMKKLSLKKMSLIAIPLLCLIPCIMIFKSVSSSSSRIVLKDQAKYERITLHDAKGDHQCHCFPPMISTNPGFQIKDITESSASFRWVCDKEATYQVNYGTTTSKGTLFPSAKPTVYYKDYTVTVTGLKPNTTYHAGPYAFAKTGGYPVKKWLMQSNNQQDWTFQTLATAVAFSIKGSILDNAGAGMSGVTVTVSGDTSYTVTTPGTGIYEFTNLKQGKNYTITPTKAECKFTPAENKYTALAANKTAQDYIGGPLTAVKRNYGEQPLIIFNVTANKITNTDANITWNTNFPSSSEVEYGLTKQYGLKSGENTELITSHYIQLFDLKPGATYHFRVISKTGPEQVSFKSEDFSLKTEALEKRIVDKNDIFVEPNPCASDVVFNYHLFKPVTNVTIDIFTLSGKKVAALEAPSSARNSGWNRIAWGVRDHSGKHLINGLYIYKMKFTKDGAEEVLERSQFMVRR